MIDPLNANGTLVAASSIPPSSPISGSRYLVLHSATGAWTGHDGKIATWGGVTWTFTAPIVDWITTLALLPSVSDNSWATNFANWYYDRIINIITDPTKLDTTAGFIFVFDKTIFKTQLQTLAPTTSQSAGINGFADAWETAMASTVFPTTLNVTPGAFIPPTSNPNLFSLVNSVIIDPASILAAKSKILELTSSTPISDFLHSDFPVKFRDATLLLTITVVGLDSTPTPAGPLPLTAVSVPLL